MSLLNWKQGLLPLKQFHQTVSQAGARRLPGFWVEFLCADHFNLYVRLFVDVEFVFNHAFLYVQETGQLKSRFW